MKNKKLIKILATVVSCLLLVCAAIGISVSAAETAPEIEYKNLAYEGKVQVVYYVNTANVPEGYTVKLATWMAVDQSDLAIKEAESFTKEVGGTVYTIFASEGIAPKKMRDTVYAQTVLYNSEDVEVDRGELVEYSVYTYVNNRLNKGATADQRALYHALVDYGASVQKVLGYKTSKLANDMFMDYSTVRDLIEANKTNNYTTADGTVNTIAVTADDGESYDVTYVNSVSTTVSPTGESFVYDSHFLITNIEKGGEEVDSVVIGGKTFARGDVAPDVILQTGSNTKKPYTTFYPNSALTTTENILSVFDTTMVVDGDRGQWRLYFSTKKSNGAFCVPYVFITISGKNIEVGGTDVAKVGEAFNLRVTAESTDTENVYLIRIYAGGVKVFEKNVTKDYDTNATSTSATWHEDTRVVDRIAIINAHSGSSTPHEPNASITFSDTTFATYTKVEEFVQVGGTNKIDYSSLETREEDYTTTYLNVSGNTVSLGTESEYDYKMVWQNNIIAGPTPYGNSFIVGRKALITSVTAFGSDAETSFSVVTSGVTILCKAGEILGDRTLGLDFSDGTTASVTINTSESLTAPENDSTLRLVWDTDIIVAPGTLTDEQPIRILYAYSNRTSTETSNQIVRIDDKVYYRFYGSDYLLGNVGEKFNLRVEIRDVDPTHPDGSASIPVEIKIFINGIETDSANDEIDTTTGKYDAMPTEVRVKTARACRDEMLIFSNTYLDVYTAPAN